jgi:outer membrane protein TolC
MRTRAALAMMRLNHLMGNPLEKEVEPTDEVASAITGLEPPAAGAGTASYLEARPDIRSARARVAMASAGVDVARSAWYPTVALAAAYEAANPNQRIIPPKERFDATWEVGVSLQWTVWDWMGASKQIAQAEAVKRQAEAGLALAVDGVALEVAQLTRQARDGMDKISAARLAVEAAEESYRVRESQFNSGLATGVDVTDARLELLRARLALTQASVDQAITHARLRRATGKPR